MKNKITILLVALFAGFSYGQDGKGQLHLTPKSEYHRLYVSFKDEGFKEKMASTGETLETLTKEYNVTYTNAINVPQEKFEALQKLALINTGSSKSVDKLMNILELKIDNPTNERMMALALSLEKLDNVEYCSLMPLDPVKPPQDIAPLTPNFIEEQSYITDYGVDMTYAWELGFTGQGVNIRDVEFGINMEHEEFNERNVSIGASMIISDQATVEYTEHGTGVFGVMYADKEGDYGVSGLAYGANEMVLFPEYEQFAGYNRVNAVTQAIFSSTEGEIILYELQATGAQGDYGPAEYERPVWDLTKAATDAGIVIIAAAGNGNENLDAPQYATYRNRGDSGAIIVGAGSSDLSHDKLYFSTYGQRVDVQGWGLNVLSSGYGDAYKIDDDFNQQYTWFSGTSSATPIVASCAVVLQSRYHAVTGRYMNGLELRELLKSTGTSQGSGGNVGPLPNMPQALAALDAVMGINSVEKESFIAYPNPVDDRLTIAGNFSANVKAEVYNAVGQQVYASDNLTGEIDFSSFSKGVYIVKITDNGKSVSKKIVKN